MDDLLRYTTFLSTSVVPTAAMGVIVTLFLMTQSRGNRHKKDVLQSILVKSAPVAASDELASSEGNLTCERRLNGKQFIITKDAELAAYIFNGPLKHNYVRRPASGEGLRRLGMYERGLIWNNNLSVWNTIRDCFQKALNNAALKEAEKVVQQEAKQLLDNCFVESQDNENSIVSNHENTALRSQAASVDMLAISRQLTFRATLRVFFGLESLKFEEFGINEEGFIAAIVAYFKAWEYFLFRPESCWEKQSLQVHSCAVTALQDHVKQLLTATETNQISTKRVVFIDLLRQACKDAEDSAELLQQGALEMLLAGTDTSSVTAYYALLGLAGDTNLQEDLRNELKNYSKALLDCTINETLRYKPVGPVVLREAVETDPQFPGELNVKKGAAVLVHLAEMNLCDKYWHDPSKFHPRRFLDSKAQKQVFFPFGEGPKGCIGMHLGRREVSAILTTVVSGYEMSIEGAETLGSLETHWDIANQPDNPVTIRIQKLRSD